MAIIERVVTDYRRMWKFGREVGLAFAPPAPRYLSWPILAALIAVIVCIAVFWDALNLLVLWLAIAYLGGTLVVVMEFSAQLRRKRNRFAAMKARRRWALVGFPAHVISILVWLLTLFLTINSVGVPSSDDETFNRVCQWAATATCVFGIWLASFCSARVYPNFMNAISSKHREFEARQNSRA